MAILNPSFENIGNWTYEENDTYSDFSGSRTTNWADQGTYSYQLTNASGLSLTGDYARIKQSVTIDKNKLRMKARWYNSTNWIYSMRVKFGGNTLWAKTMNIGSPSPPIIENVDVDVSAYLSQTNDLILELYILGTSGSNHNGWVQWDNLILYNDYYVKTNGDDSLSGASWANAWATINKAATTVADGSTVHIGVGTYNAEPASNKIAPQNIGASGIEYTIVNATTGLPATGSVIVEKN